jgi:hypothetical protein
MLYRQNFFIDHRDWLRPLFTSPDRSVGRAANGVTRRFSAKAARPFQLRNAARSGLLNSNVTIEDHAKRNAVWFYGERLEHTFHLR